MERDFNIIITGVGGQGIITLLKVIAGTALIDNHEVRTSELHGLSQKGGSVNAHIRFGKNIFSPLIMPGQADLVLGLEMTEALRMADFLDKKGILLVNKRFISFFNGLSERQALARIKKLPFKTYFIEASRICQKELDKEIVAGIYLLSYAISKELIPLSIASALKAIKKIVKPKHFSLNRKAFKLGQIES